MNLTDQLLQQATKYLDKAEKSRTNDKFYQKLISNLPSVFPAPDDLYIKDQGLEYDLALYYSLKDSEKDEALRLILSITFGAIDWEGEVDKATKVFTLRAVSTAREYSILLKIIGASLNHYQLLDTRDVGSKVVGKLKCIKFIPWESTRPEITPDILVAYCEESNKTSYIDCQRARILSELATGLPVDILSADRVEATLGLEYDVDIIYEGDPVGKKEIN